MSRSDQSVRIKVNDELYADFTRLYIRISLDEICHYLELDVSEADRRKIGRHDKIEVEYLVGNQPSRRVTIVEVDTISRLLNAGSKSYRVTARSRARNILDSSYSEQLKDLTLYQIVQQIAGRFDIPVANYAGNTEKIARFEWEAESPWQKLLTAASAQNCILHSSENGGLCLNKVSGNARSEGFQLVQNRNIEEISIEENGNEQFRRYEVFGNSGKAEAIDNTCKIESRIMSINISDDSMSLADLRRWANVQRNRRRNQRLRIRMTGWGLDTEELAVLYSRTRGRSPKLFGLETLWGVNFYIPVTLPEYGVQRRYLLTTQVEFTVEGEAISCNLSLKPREDYLES
ncbi:hypothetical protein P0082_07735 [Candidatus Haliotispira prima]|uniref:Baseplate hub protein gp44/GpP-like second domain-containing protein n=1 Tax=Candidatus Haliotispira prima TaxID=3034016 RepID=A0ABY8MEL7_9SPIO|nr:hypothetical protein P0082_07735 [Candidatus Haliotispira prima]